MVLRHVPSSALFLPSVELRALEVPSAQQANENWIDAVRQRVFSFLMPPDPCCYSRFSLVNSFFPFLSFFLFSALGAGSITFPLPFSICHFSVNIVLLRSLSL